MILIALTLSICILIFCGFQARKNLISLRAALPELESLGQLIDQSEVVADLLTGVGQAEFKHPMVRQLARQLRLVFSKPNRNVRGQSGWLLDPDELFQFDGVLKRNMLTRRVQAMPTLLTGLGIFFTFMGLTISTFGLDPSDAEGLSQSVKQLVGGMSLAFSTSLTGIGCSLWWTWTQKIIEQTIESACYRLSRGLAMRPFVLNEKEWYVWNQEAQQRQLEILPAEMSRELLSGLKAQFGPVIERIQPSLAASALNEHLQSILVGLEELGQKLDTMIEHSKQDKHDGPRNEIKDSKDAILELQNLVANLDPIQKNQQEVVQGVQQAIMALTESSEGALNSQKTLFKAQEEMNRNLKWIREYWQTYREQIHDLEQGLRSGIVEFKTHMEQSNQESHKNLDGLLAESLSHFSKTLAEMNGSLNTLSAVIETLNKNRPEPRKKGIFGS